MGIDGSVTWIQLAQDSVQWQTLVNTVMDLQVTYKGRGNFLIVWATVNVLIWTPIKIVIWLLVSWFLVTYVMAAQQVEMLAPAPDRTEYHQRVDHILVKYEHTIFYTP
jgi:hypothetical protein